MEDETRKLDRDTRERERKRERETKGREKGKNRRKTSVVTRRFLRVRVTSRDDWSNRQWCPPWTMRHWSGFSEG